MQGQDLTQGPSEPRAAKMCSFHIFSLSSLQRYALSGAVADLASR
jgi:hypothetical protein